ncbi:DUF4124 domain-containing protein [Ramlibacter sp.]|uniref:DUF4124 domain-containing protein n=1 Tax=Ramlibacter sp. TaxID=1917967 RepID=UPI0035B1E393
MQTSWSLIAATLVLGTGAAGAWAQKGIYTCVDSQGRRLTSDRPIQECIDREQKELSGSGTVRRTLGPSLTATERAALEEKQRAEIEERKRAAEDKRRDRALIARYPNQAAHDLERQKALASLGEVIKAANRRLADLYEQRRKLMVETEFYAKDPSKMPLKLKRELDENDKLIQGQQNFIANQEEEKKRANQRFDEELKKLKVLWAPPPLAAPAPAPAATTAATPAPAKK